MTIDEHLNIANQNKLEGYYRDIPVYSNPFVPDGMVYMMNANQLSGPKRKDGRPDMRYSVNKILRWSAFQD